MRQQYHEKSPHTGGPSSGATRDGKGLLVRRWLALFVLVAVSLAAGPVTARNQPAHPQAPSLEQPPAGVHAPGVDTITEAQLRDYLTFIAADELQGRDTPSTGLDVAARFLATLLSRWGYEPGGDDGSFFQTIALTRRHLDLDRTSLSIGKQTLTIGEDYLPSARVPGTAAGALVYIGHGYVIKSRKVDPYGGLDVQGKVLLMHPGLPEGLHRSDLKGPKGEDWEDGPAAAARLGAVGVLYLADYPALDRWQRTRRALDARGAVSVDAFDEEAEGQTLPTATLAPSALAAVFAGESVTAANIFRRVAEGTPAAPFALASSKRVTLTISTTDTHERTQNVVAILPGGDPVLRNEYVALGAHYDHVGLATDGRAGDIIYNGADDDGSGTVGLLGMAEAFARATERPKRSILFVWHTGEEKGLWGARYFTAHPTVALDQIVTQINVDMIGRSRPDGETTAGSGETLTGPNAVYVIGSRLMSSALGKLTDEVNDRFLRVAYDYRYADPTDANRFFYRSDHYHYAKHGIPVIFFFSGVHEDYHDVGDEVDKIDFRKMRRLAQTVYATAWAVAQLPSRPAVDTVLARELLTQ